MQKKAIFFCFSNRSQKMFLLKIKDPDPKQYKRSKFFAQKNSRQKLVRRNYIDPKQIPTFKQILPQQYPKCPLDDSSALVRRGRSIRLIEPNNQVPLQKYVDQNVLIKEKIYNNKWQSPQNSYILNIGLIGPVNSGKSQLMSKLIDKRVSAVSPKANTTQEIIKSFKSYQNYTQHKQSKLFQYSQGQSQGGPQQEKPRNIQLKFYDTPGLMYKKTGFVSKGWKVLSQIDFSLLVVDCAKRFDDMVKESIRRIQMHRNYENFMKALVLNKIDLVDNKRKFHSLISEIERYGKFDKIFYTSALTNYGIKQLQSYLLKMAKPGEWQNPKQVTAQLSQIDIYTQMLKEAIYNRTYKQLPYLINFQCESSALKSNGIEVIRFRLNVDTENQQRILVGKQGKNIQNIKQRFKILFAEMYQRECQCFIKVSVRSNFNKKNPGKQETLYWEEQKDKIKSKINAVEQKLRKTGRLINILNPQLNKPDKQDNKIQNSLKEQIKQIKQ